MRSLRMFLPALIGFATIAGCTSYYHVTDPSTGHDYYTTEIKREGGATMLHDAKTARDVTIQNSEVMKITQQEYEAALKAP